MKWQVKIRKRKGKNEMDNKGGLNGLSILLDQVNDEVSSRIDAKIKETVDSVKKQLDELKRYTPTVVVGYDGKKSEVKGLKHKQLNDLIKLVGADQNVMITGMAGTGKTHSAGQVAEALGLDFYAMSVGSQTSKADLLGYMDANGKYVRSLFREAYEKGGVYVMDEIDAGNSNVLIVLNSALSNGHCSFPDGMVSKNKNFRFIATANTYGNGADRTYVGRNQIDGATLDRFTNLDWNVDENLEEDMVSNFMAGGAWVHTVRELRKDVKDKSIRAIISPRMSVKGSMALELGFTPTQAVEMVVLPQIPEDKRKDILENTIKTFSKMMAKYPIKSPKEPKTTTTSSKTTERAKSAVKADESVSKVGAIEDMDFTNVPF